MEIKIKRVYEAPSKDDGIRLLVDRLWPRGMKKEELFLDSWAKELAPSSELRQWFNHEPGKFKEFEKRYFQELDANAALWRPLMEKYKNHPVTLLYASKEPLINHAQCLKTYLVKHFH